MANERRDLAEAQRRATEALTGLTQQLRATSSPGASGASTTGAPGEAATARAFEEVVGALRETTSGLTAGTSALNRTLSGAASALASLGSGLGGVGAGGGFGGLLKGGFGLAPLASAVVGLFGGKKEPPPVYEPYREPAPIRIETLNSGAGAATAATGGSNSRIAAASPQATPIVVNVQAIDSRSFLDHANDIAQAVRDAMLHMHPVNDVINEL